MVGFIVGCIFITGVCVVRFPRIPPECTRARKSFWKYFSKVVVLWIPPQVQYLSRGGCQYLGALGSLSNPFPVANLAGWTSIGLILFIEFETGAFAFPTPFRRRNQSCGRRQSKHGFRSLVACSLLSLAFCHASVQII